VKFAKAAIFGHILEPESDDLLSEAARPTIRMRSLCVWR
jgi:hypothetical protein